MAYYGYHRRRYRGGFRPNYGAVQSHVNHSLKVPISVYEKLKKRFAALSSAEDRVFLEKYRQLYGENAYEYLVKTYRSVRIGDQYLLRASPSGRTLERILQLVPTVMSSDERFALFEDIIDYNEPEGEIRSYSVGQLNFEKSLSFSYEEWVRSGENQLRSCIGKIGEAVSASIDYTKKYDFSDIAWLLDQDIAAFCHLIENTRKAKIRSQITVALSDVSMLKQKWHNLSQGKVSAVRHSELKYQFSMAGQHVSVTIYDAEERARLARREKVNDLLGKVGCLSVIVILILLMILGK